jgi:hypothetical protein
MISELTDADRAPPPSGPTQGDAELCERLRKLYDHEARAEAIDRIEALAAQVAERDAKIKEWHNAWIGMEKRATASEARVAELERERDALRLWLNNNTTYYDVDADWPVEGHNIPVLAQVSNRIWYHATDDCTSYPFSTVADAAIGKTQPVAPAIDAALAATKDAL